MADTPVSPTNVTALPTAPNRNTQTNPLTYSQTADAWAGALPTWTTQVNNIASNVNFNADSAFDSAAEALASASAAASSASSASTSASNASTSASNAASSASAASTSASNAAASYDLFDDRYLGAKASDPSVDNDGNPLVTGAMYFNTTSNTTRIYNGSGWQDSAAIATSINLATQVSGTLAVANGGTGITSFGAGIATFLGTPSSANLASAVTDETGSGALVFGTSPTLTDPKISLGGTNGTAGQVPVSQGAGLPPVWGGKQDTLVSGTNIKTVGGQTLLGSGDIPLGGGFSNMTVFTASGTWTVPSGVTKCKVTVVGGGGGGDNDGGGGGGGGTAIKIVSGLTPGSGITVTVGAGGAANSGNGGTSSFGAHCSATGGTNPTNNDRGGIGGIGSSGDLNIRGGDGLRYSADTTSLRLSAGGGTHLGGAPATNTAATAGGNYGTGGAGNAAGAAGVVVIEY